MPALQLAELIPRWVSGRDDGRSNQCPWEKFSRQAAPDDLVAPRFKFYELTKSELAARLGIDNSFPIVKEAHAAVLPCRNVMEAVREQFGPCTPNSVFLGQDLERALKKRRSDWVSKSQHTLRQACDVEVPGVPNVELARWVIENIEFDQVIVECYNSKAVTIPDSDIT
jgi:hypothetical protein